MLECTFVARNRNCHAKGKKLQASQLSNPPPKMKDVIIKVIRKACYADLSALYENPIEHTCDVAEGEEFLSLEGQQPEGLCDSAWETLRPFVKTLAEGGGNFYDGWMKNPHSALLSCNDGFRPVSFLVETVED